MDEANYTVYVTASKLNVRSEGSKDATAVGSLSWGTQVTVTGIVRCNGQTNGWLRIQSGNLTGYVSGQYVSDTKPVATATPAPATATPAPTATPVAPEDDYYPLPTSVAISAPHEEVIIVWPCGDGSGQFYDDAGDRFVDADGYSTFTRVSDGKVYYCVELYYD